MPVRVGNKFRLHRCLLVTLLHLPIWYCCGSVLTEIGTSCRPRAHLPPPPHLCHLTALAAPDTGESGSLSLEHSARLSGDDYSASPAPGQVPGTLCPRLSQAAPRCGETRRSGGSGGALRGGGGAAGGAASSAGSHRPVMGGPTRLLD